MQPGILSMQLMSQGGNDDFKMSAYQIKCVDTSDISSLSHPDCYGSPLASQSDHDSDEGSKQEPELAMLTPSPPV